jgi:S-adenosyl-L-methionine hydrolase (adenosine-forming)
VKAVQKAGLCPAFSFSRSPLSPSRALALLLGNGMIVLYTDFGVTGPYVGQLHAVLERDAPGVTVVDLLHTVPAFDVRAGAYLLPALARDIPAGAVIMAVVDPEVGGERAPVMVRADDRWYVGPDNGLLELVWRRARQKECRDIRWRPSALAPSFHGRDLFAPVAACLARGGDVAAEPASLREVPMAQWPDDLPRIVYVDHYGNAVSGLRASALGAKTALRVNGKLLSRARVFAEVPRGTAFWYENSSGLAEIAVNQGDAAALLGLCVGTEVGIE